MTLDGAPSLHDEIMEGMEVEARMTVQVLHRLREIHQGAHLSAGCRDVAASDGNQCLCNIGVQECSSHPGRLKSQEDKIAFRKAWDAKVR